jgi:hypothetical protein
MNQILQIIVISIIIIFLIDSLLNYFRDTYTTKKTKDVVGLHIKKYQSIMDQIHKESSQPPVCNSISDLEIMNMNAELESLLHNELNNT